MGEKTSIEWCDFTFNPWWGCQRISPGCLHCYADREATRHGFPGQFAATAPHREFGTAHWNEPLKWAKKAAREGIRRRAFCASMADVGEDHPVAEANRPRLWKLMEDTPELDWMLLTKRVSTAQEWLPERWLKKWPAHVWFGFSAEDQKRWDERWPFAREVSAAVRFCSYEPALGPVDFTPLAGLHLLIAGGESGPGARPSHPDWFRSARDQAVAAGVAFHFKQWGEYRRMEAQPQPACPASGRSASGIYQSYLSKTMDDGTVMEKAGKKIAGRLLDGALWDEMPVTPEVQPHDLFS